MNFSSASSHQIIDETAKSIHHNTATSINTKYAQNNKNTAKEETTTLSTPTLSTTATTPTPSATASPEAALSSPTLSTHTTIENVSSFTPTHSYAISAPATSTTVTFNPTVTTFTARWTHDTSSEGSSDGSSSAKSSFSSSTYSSAVSEASAAAAVAAAAAAAVSITSSSTTDLTPSTPPRPPPRKGGVATHKSPAQAASSFVVKCLLKTVRFMWQVTEIPTKIGETLGTIYRYAQDSVETILCVAGKARRKERDGDQNSTDTKLYLEESVLERKLPEADLKALVDLPAGLDYNEWLASHTLALFEHVNLVYGTVSEFCTPSGCPDMTGPGNRTYLWFDEKGKKTRVAAPQYIDYVMTFTQKTVSDESIFPTKYANEFPSSFESIARKILRLQFHVIAHLYAAHFREIALLGLHTHLNLTFAHLTALHRRFTLIDEKETDVLRDLEVALRLTDDGQSSLASSTIAATTDGGSSGCGGSGGGGSGGGSTTDSGIANSSSSCSSGVGGGNSQQQQQQHSGVEDVNSLQQQQQQQQQSASSLAAGTTLIDGDAAAPPICTQPEAQAKQPNNAHASTAAAVFGGGGGLIGGILGDLSSGEFGETATRYCTSALPSQQQQHPIAEAGGATTGAGALHLNFNSNHHNHHHHHHHHPHHQHAHQQAAAAAAAATTAQHHHFTQQQHQHQQHSGLIQCNASNAPNASTVSGAATASTNAGAAASATTTTA